MNILYNREDIRVAVDNIADKIVRAGNIKDTAIIGIKTRGAFIAKRIKNIIKEKYLIDVPIGELDISLYRDDFSIKAKVPKLKGSDISFNIENKRIIVVDDVLFTGRTIRAAINAIMDYGRAARIELAILVERSSGRELPICCNYSGFVVQTAEDKRIYVRLVECDGEEFVYEA